MSTLNKDQP